MPAATQLEPEEYMKSERCGGPMPSRPLDAFVNANNSKLLYCGIGRPGELKVSELDLTSFESCAYSARTNGRLYCARAAYDEPSNSVYMIGTPFESPPGEPTEKSFLARIPLDNT